MHDDIIEDLECAGLRIIQNKAGYRFTTDAVLLANFAKVKKDGRVIDLGTGSGVVPILMSRKTGGKEFVGIEIQERLADMAERSVKLNSLEKKIKIIRGDIKDAHKILGYEGFDSVTANPPYALFTGEKSRATEKEICKSEVFITLREIIEEAGKLLTFGGSLYLVIKSPRMFEAMRYMNNFDIEPKILIPVQPAPEKDVDTVLIEGKKGGKAGLKIKKPLDISADARRIYGK
jgi:Predicted O-methyltransferase